MVTFGRRPKTLTFEEFKAQALKVRCKDKREDPMKKTHMSVIMAESAKYGLGKPCGKKKTLTESDRLYVAKLRKEVEREFNIKRR